MCVLQTSVANKLELLNAVGVCAPHLVDLAPIVSETLLFRRTDRDGRGYIDSAVNADQKYIHFIGSVMPSPSRSKSSILMPTVSRC